MSIQPNLGQKTDNALNETLKYPKWQAEFQEVVIELDREKLFDKIKQFETAIFARLQELETLGDDHEERQAIDDALTAVRVLKNEDLGRTT